MDVIQAHVETPMLERIFELLDSDFDGYITMSDFELFKEPRALIPSVSKMHIAERFISPNHELSFHMQTLHIESVAQKTLRLHENHNLFDFGLMSKLMFLHLRHHSYRAGTCGYDVQRLPLSVFGIPDVVANPKAAKDSYWPNIEDFCTVIGNRAVQSSPALVSKLEAFRAERAAARERALAAAQAAQAAISRDAGKDGAAVEAAPLAPQAGDTEASDEPEVPEES